MSSALCTLDTVKMNGNALQLALYEVPILTDVFVFQNFWAQLKGIPEGLFSQTLVYCNLWFSTEGPVCLVLVVIQDCNVGIALVMTYLCRSCVRPLFVGLSK